MDLVAVVLLNSNTAAVVVVVGNRDPAVDARMGLEQMDVAFRS